MALHKESYGLIYNDDGSLCTTIREDDVPFEGVKSFAVEEGTENVIADPSFETGTGWTFTGGGSRINIDSWHGKYCAKSTNNLSTDITQTDIQITGGTTYTLSWWGKSDTPGNPSGNGFVHFKLYDDTDTEITTAINGWGYSTSFGYHQIITLQNYWQRQSVQIEMPSNAVKMSLYFSWRAGTNPGTYALFDAIQLEQKPFATSFVDGTRQHGNITLPINLENGNFVISFEFKPDWIWGSIPEGVSGEQSYNLATYGTPGSNGFLFRIEEGTGKINLETYASAVSLTTDPANFGLANNDWAHFVLVSDVENTIKLYINGQLAITNYNSDYDPPTENKLFIGSRRNSSAFGRANGLFSNIYIGKAKDDGNLVWTDEYIQELYNARKPFSVPPRLPIL